MPATPSQHRPPLDRASATEPTRSFCTGITGGVRNERERIILGFSDAELLRWWNTFGYCPHWKHEARLQLLLHQRGISEWSGRGITRQTDGDKRRTAVSA